MLDLALYRSTKSLPGLPCSMVWVRKVYWIGEDDLKDPTCMGVVLDLKCISTQARCEIRCPLSRRSHRALVLDLSVAATKAPWASRQPHLMKGCTTEEDAKPLIDLICVMDLIRALLVSALQLLEAHRWLGGMQSSCNHTLKTS